MINNTDRRNFYLMLSPQEGQDYAKTMDFPPPSDDVRDIEEADIMSRWAVFVMSGVYNEVVEGAEWFADFLERSDKLVSPKDDIMAVLSIYGIAIVNKLLETENIVLVMDNMAKILEEHMGDEFNE